jgi:hypothetical protein
LQTTQSWSEQLVDDWYWHAVYVAGRALPLNYLELLDDNIIRMGYMAPTEAEAIPVEGGSPVRLVVLQYQLANLQDTLKH